MKRLKGRRWPRTRLEDELAQIDLFTGRVPNVTEVVRARLTGLSERQKARDARRARARERRLLGGGQAIDAGADAPLFED